ACVAVGHVFAADLPARETSRAAYCEATVRARPRRVDVPTKYSCEASFVHSQGVALSHSKSVARGEAGSVLRANAGSRQGGIATLALAAQQIGIQETTDAKTLVLLSDRTQKHDYFLQRRPSEQAQRSRMKKPPRSFAEHSIEVRDSKRPSDHDVLYGCQNDQRWIKNGKQCSSLKFPLLTGNRDKSPIAQERSIDDITNHLHLFIPTAGY